MVMALPLSNDSTAARRSTFFSKRFARFTRSFPRFSGVSFLHGPSKAFRAAATARSTSFSVASWTETMTDSSAGLMTSKVLPSTAFTNSLLMKLDRLSAKSSFMRGRLSSHNKEGQTEEEPNIGPREELTYRPVGWSYSPVCGVLSLTERPDMVIG
jgi:hypothetical protein